MGFTLTSIRSQIKMVSDLLKDGSTVNISSSEFKFEYEDPIIGKDYVFTLYHSISQRPVQFIGILESFDNKNILLNNIFPSIHEDDIYQTMKFTLRFEN